MFQKTENIARPKVYPVFTVRVIDTNPVEQKLNRSTVFSVDVVHDLMGRAS